MLKKIFLLVVSAFVLMVGTLYTATIIFNLPVFKADPPGAYYLLALSIFFLASGVFFVVQALRGGLKRQGGTIIDVRLEAVAKMDSIELLTQISKNDPVRKVREKAKKRLKEIAAHS